MSFDPRSRERLEALGRTLPRKLPAPAAGGPSDREVEDRGPRKQRLHPVETERDPERLFRELMDVSPDGTVPPHLLERLREAEARRDPPSPPSASPVPSGPRQPTRPKRAGPPGRSDGSDPQDLYVAFQQLLLEDEESI